MSYANRTSEGAMVTSFGMELLGERYGRDPLTHEEIEALDLKAVTEEDEEIPSEQMRHGIFRIEHPDDASGFVGSISDSTRAAVQCETAIRRYFCCRSEPEVAIYRHEPRRGSGT